MISFPNCKINIGLNIVGKRSDGYHNLETVFYPLQLEDAVEVIQHPTFYFTSSGLAIAGTSEDNLCVKAYNLLKHHFPALPPVQIHLHKAIPMGAGLGGGSADGAFMLQLLNKKFHLNLTEQQLMNYALALGSDCPFFIINKPCLGSGRGEVLEPVELDLSQYKIVLVNPGLHVTTKDAFSHLSSAQPAISIIEIIAKPITDWKHNLLNDFEVSIFKLYPAIKKIKEDLYSAGALYSSMTGTGSTVYGIFNSNTALNFSFPTHYMTFTINNNN